MTTPAEDLQLAFNEWMHWMLDLKLIPSMIASGVDRKGLQQWKLNHPALKFEMPELSALFLAQQQTLLEEVFGLINSRPDSSNYIDGDEQDEIRARIRGELGEVK